MKKAGNLIETYERMAIKDQEILVKFLEKDMKIMEKNARIKQLERALDAANSKNIETTPRNGVEVHPLKGRAVKASQAESRETRKIAGENSQNWREEDTSVDAKVKENASDSTATADKKPKKTSKPSLPSKIAIGVGMAVTAVWSTQGGNAIRGLAHAVDVYGTAGGEGPAVISTGVISAAKLGLNRFLNLVESDVNAFSSAVGNSAKALAGLIAAHPVATAAVVIGVAAACSYALCQCMGKGAREKVSIS
jgi:hypothetical protein